MSFVGGKIEEGAVGDNGGDFHEQCAAQHREGPHSVRGHHLTAGDGHLWRPLPPVPHCGDDKQQVEGDGDQWEGLHNLQAGEILPVQPVLRVRGQSGGGQTEQQQLAARHEGHPGDRQPGELQPERDVDAPVREDEDHDEQVHQGRLPPPAV